MHPAGGRVAVVAAALSEWAATSAEAGLRSAPELGADLVARYQEPHRAYHNLDHLAQVLQDLSALAADPRLRLAAWFHDAIYEPGSPDNETGSAELARVELTARGMDPEAIEFIAQAILATAEHSSADPRFAPLLDADMATLGAPPAAYRAYAAAIRREFSQVPAALFDQGRRAFVQELLDRPRIFITDEARDRFEAPARRNLRSELAVLSP